MAKVGRPSKIDTIDLKQVERIAGMGFVDTEIAHILGISVATLNTYKDKPEFLEALKKGKAVTDEKVANALLQNALGGFKLSSKKTFDRHGKKKEVYETFAKPDVTAQIFWLKSRRPDLWKDKHEIDHGLADPILEKYKELSSADLIKAARAAGKALLGTPGSDSQAKEDKPA